MHKLNVISCLKSRFKSVRISNVLHDQDNKFVFSIITFVRMSGSRYNDTLVIEIDCLTIFEIDGFDMISFIVLPMEPIESFVDCERFNSLVICHVCRYIILEIVLHSVIIRHSRRYYCIYSSFLNLIRFQYFAWCYAARRGTARSGAMMWVCGICLTLIAGRWM